MSNYCPIGSLHLHTMNFEGDQCIWCGTDALAWKPGKWVLTPKGQHAWKADKGDDEEAP